MSISSTGGVTNFNPRSREGSDRSRCDGCPQRRHFNPRSREGSDAPGDKVRVTNQGFQSTLPRRERPCAAPPSVPFGTFQSTLPRRERRFYLAPAVLDRKISIHAPAKGATLKAFAGINAWAFQSTLPRRERHTTPIFSVAHIAISIHAPAKGAT